MKKIKIESKDGFLTMRDLPHNCIFNKVVTGCGATTIALNNDINYVVAVPTTELIENKCYPTHDKDGKIQYWKKKDRKPGLSPVVNIFAVYGAFNLNQKHKLQDYLATEGVKKIMCTYDQLPKVTEIVNPSKFGLIVDEYHTILKAYSYRDKAINGVLATFRKYKHFTFISATPIPFELKPSQLDGVPELTAEWNTVPGIRIFPIHTNKPYEEVVKLVTVCKKNDLEIDGRIVNSLIFFINSVTEIRAILDKLDLSTDEYKVICADNPTNRSTLGKEIEISSSTSEPKQFTFVTSKAFEGVDFYSETAVSVIVCNVHNAHTLISTSLDIPQIAGRIRTKSNPLRNTIVQIYNTSSVEAMSYEDKKTELNAQMQLDGERAKELTKACNRMSEEARNRQLAKLGDELRYDAEHDKIVVNDLFFKLHLYSHIVQRLTYSRDINLIDSLNAEGISTGSISWDIIPATESKKLTRRNFRDSHKRYCEIRKKFWIIPPDEIARLEANYPILAVGYHRLGLKRLISLRNIKDIEAAIKESS